MMQIELMRSDPILRHGGKSSVVKGVHGELLRLLVLREGKTVKKAEIADLHETDIGHIGSKIRYLREQLPEWLDADAFIANDYGSGWRADLSYCTVDALDFRLTVEEILRQPFKPLAHSMSPDVALKEATSLKEVLSLWEANPAAGLPHQTGLEARYDSLKAGAEDRLAVARLYTRDRGHIREAIQQLKIQIRRGEADVQTWTLLLLAHDAMGGAAQVRATFDEISTHFSDKVPAELLRTMAAVSGSTDLINPFRNDPPAVPVNAQVSDAGAAQDADQMDSLHAICELMGITTASRLRLLDSNLTPTACIRRTRQRLNFSGVLASKWVMEPGVRSEFDQLLYRLDATAGEARFLMINPKGEGYRRLSELRQGQISLESVPHLKALEAAHPSFEVRAFDSLPSFRIVIIDDDVVSFSPYRLAADVYAATERGWEAPHVVLDPIAQYPLSEAFQLLFNETWHSAVPLEAA